jgi:hypothetical protein
LINHCKRQVSRCGGRKPDGGAVGLNSEA